MKNQDFSDNRPMLTRHDLISLEPFLREGLARFVHFEAVSLAFPPEELGQAEHLRAERRLLLPLRLRGRFLGLLVARGVRLKAPRTTMERLPQIMEMILENLLLAKQGRLDPETGLASRDCFLRTMESEVEAVQSFLLPRENPLDWRGGFGCLHLELGLEPLAERWGPLRADQALRRLASQLSLLAEENQERPLPARASDQGLALLCPGGGAKSMSRLAAEAVKRLSELVLEHEISGETLKVSGHSGIALYPRDMEGAYLEQSPAEQARRLLLRAREAALAAKSLGKPLLEYGRILAEGGRVLACLPMDRLETSLGRRHGAREGQHFHISGKNDSAS